MPNTTGMLLSEFKKLLNKVFQNTDEVAALNIPFTDIAASGDVTVGDTLAVTGATTLASTLAVTGATTMASTLAVTGNETVGGTLAVTSNETVGGTLGVTGATTLSSTLGVTGTLTAAQINFTGDLDGSATSDLYIQDANIEGALNHTGVQLGFYNNGTTSKLSVTGSRGGNAALASLLTQLAALGLITNSTTA